MRIIEAMSPFQSTHKDITYLGIRLTPKILHLYGANYPPLLRQLKKDLARWRTAYTSRIGRINAIKMNVLSRLLYVFQGLPIPVDRILFVNLKKMVTKFIWQGQRVRLSHWVLTKAGRGVGFTGFLGVLQSGSTQGDH